MSQSPFEIRYAQSDDIHAIALIEKQCFSHGWSENSLQSEISKQSSRLIVGVVNSAVVGYMSFGTVLDEGYINNVAVHRDFRKIGIATAMILRSISAGKDMGLSFLTLEVRTSNSAAIALYSKCGFLSVGARKNFYSSPDEDGLLMTYTY